MLLGYLHFMRLAYEGYTINPVCILAEAGLNSQESIFHLNPFFILSVRTPQCFLSVPITEVPQSLGRHKFAYI